MSQKLSQGLAIHGIEKYGILLSINYGTQCKIYKQFRLQHYT